MSAVTYHRDYTPTAGLAAAPRNKGLFARIVHRIMEARMQQAAREIERHLGYLPEDVRRRYHRAVKEAQRELPFDR